MSGFLLWVSGFLVGDDPVAVLPAAARRRAEYGVVRGPVEYQDAGVEVVVDRVEAADAVPLEPVRQGRQDLPVGGLVPRLVAQNTAEVPLRDDVEQGRAVDPDERVGVEEGEAPCLGQEARQAELVEQGLAGDGRA